MKKLKIAVYTDNFYPGMGGTERATYSLCKALLSLGHEVAVFCPDYKKPETILDFPIVRVKSLKLTKNDRMVYRKMQYKYVLKLTQQFAPDIIYYCTASGMARIAIDIAKKLNKPCIATMHTKFNEAVFNSSKSRIFTHFFIKSLVNKLNKADNVVCVSNDMAEMLKKYGYKKATKVIRNGTDHINGLEIVTNKNDNVLNFLFCGHIIKVKNIQFTLKALAYLKENKNVPNFKFYIIGEGNYKNKLEKIAKKLNLKDNVVFVGYVGDKEVLANYYANAHLFLFPSTFDTDGLVVCEAAKLGTPTLTLKGYGASERLTDNVNGFISEYNLEAFAERIYEIINNKELYKNVCTNTSTIFGETWNQVAIRYETLFTEEINKKIKN